MVTGRRKQLEREIDRDARVTTSGYVHEVMTLTLGQLQRVSLGNKCPDPVDLFDEVDAITRKFRNFHRRLNDERIHRRGDRSQRASTPETLPPAVQPFAYHGAYVGAFPSVEAFAHACLDPAQPDQWAAYVDLTQAGIDLHLSGRYWTVDAGGVTHAFSVASRDEAHEGPDEPAPGRVGAEGWQAGVMKMMEPGRSVEAPPPPHYDPERARSALAQAGCDAQTIAELMTYYVAGYVNLEDHVWYFLRRGGVPGDMLGHIDIDAVARQWCRRSAIAWVVDPLGGVQVFGFADPLTSEV